MMIALAAPFRESRRGNAVQAGRWTAYLEALGHRVVSVAVRAGQAPGDLRGDALIALHARRSHAVVAAWRARTPRAPIALVLTGTDVYRDIRTDARAQRSLEIADRLVVLQPLAADELAPALREKTRVIYQSCEPAFKPSPADADPDAFEVCVVGHLRPVKDPFRIAEAVRRLPPRSRVRVVHVGAALGADMRRRAEAESARGPRYRWIGERGRDEALAIIARSRLLVLTSLLEGGANVISEAVVCGTPVISSAIPGSIGLLGADYPGLFPAGDAAALADLLVRAEADAAFRLELARRCAAIAPLVSPARERTGLAELVADLAALNPGSGAVG